MPDEGSDQTDLLIEETVVIGDREAARKVAGSGTVLNQLQLDLADHTDLHQIVASVPGIYFRKRMAMVCGLTSGFAAPQQIEAKKSR
jgi:outer membrane receptor for Fe3+-dicitrate